MALPPGKRAIRAGSFSVAWTTSTGRSRSTIMRAAWGRIRRAANGRIMPQTSIPAARSSHRACYTCPTASAGSEPMQSNAATVDEYLDSLPADRREALEQVRAVIKDNLPDGLVEAMDWGMI